MTAHSQSLRAKEWETPLFRKDTALISRGTCDKIPKGGGTRSGEEAALHSSGGEGEYFKHETERT